MATGVRTAESGAQHAARGDQQNPANESKSGALCQTIQPINPEKITTV